MLRSSPSFDFEAQFHHAQEGYSDSCLNIDSQSHMDRRLQRKIVAFQKRFHRYGSRAPPSTSHLHSAPPRRHSHTPRKPFISNLPHAFKTFITRSPASHSPHVPRRLNRLHGADNSRMSVLSSSLRREFRKISYHTPQSSSHVANLHPSPSSPTPHPNLKRHRVAYRHQKPRCKPQPQLQPQPQPQPQPSLEPEPELQSHSEHDSHLELHSEPEPKPEPELELHSAPHCQILQNTQLKEQGIPYQFTSHSRKDLVRTQILPSSQTPLSRVNEEEQHVTEPHQPPREPSQLQPQHTQCIDSTLERTSPQPQSKPRSKPFVLPLDISTLIDKYDKDNTSLEKPNLTAKRPSLIPEAQHKFATMRALFEGHSTEKRRTSSLKSPPRSYTAPFLSSKPYSSLSPLSVEHTSLSPSSENSPPTNTLHTNPDHFSKRHGTRFAKTTTSPESPFNHSGRAESSVISSLTKSPENEAVLDDADLVGERIDPGSLFEGADKRDLPERMNLKDLFDSLELPLDGKQNLSIKSPNPDKIRESPSAVAKLIARYSETGQVADKTDAHIPEMEHNVLRGEEPRVEEKVNRSLVLGEEDEIEKVYKSDAKDKKEEEGQTAVYVPERKGGVEAIPWEARIKSFNVEIEDVASMAQIRKVVSHDAESNRFKSFSIYSGTDQDSKLRTRSETSGRRWRRRSVRAQNKSWLSRKAHEQVHRVKKHVVSMKNIISADDY
ncbi:unnamed protein product [Agarophyton chilense]|eukprot:gb/GEZJ01002010.1/.p1 GENE.gb/GEZJ01002010.1/~~gb/GEZJ01002010.1/.p1  ORF type:complete len:835 (-),score=95.18 gb/GEZJ01002010.1/:715-2874(-)